MSIDYMTPTGSRVETPLGDGEIYATGVVEALVRLSATGSVETFPYEQLAPVVDRTVTFWSSGGRHEWLLREGARVVARSGLVHRSRGACRTDLKRWLRAEQAGVAA